MSKRRTRKIDMGETLWLTIPIGGNIWRVFLADPDDCPILSGCEGITVHRKSAIYLDQELEDSRLISVLGHEIVHALFANSNEEMTTAIFGCQGSDIIAAEERVAVYVGSVFLDGLQRAGFLKLPRRPR